MLPRETSTAPCRQAALWDRITCTEGGGVKREHGEARAAAQEQPLMTAPRPLCSAEGSTRCHAVALARPSAWRPPCARGRRCRVLSAVEEAEIPTRSPMLLLSVMASAVRFGAWRAVCARCACSIAAAHDREGEPEQRRLALDGPQSRTSRELLLSVYHDSQPPSMLIGSSKHQRPRLRTIWSGRLHSLELVQLAQQCR